jgi:hypothetical protein
MGFGRIRAGHQQNVGLHDVGDGVGHRPRTECRRQTGDATAVSETGAMVYVIGTDNGAGELL